MGTYYTVSFIYKGKYYFLESIKFHEHFYYQRLQELNMIYYHNLSSMYIKIIENLLSWETTSEEFTNEIAFQGLTEREKKYCNFYSNRFLTLLSNILRIKELSKCVDENQNNKKSSFNFDNSFTSCYISEDSNDYFRDHFGWGFCEDNKYYISINPVICKNQERMIYFFNKLSLRLYVYLRKLLQENESLGNDRNKLLVEFNKFFKGPIDSLTICEYHPDFPPIADYKMVLQDVNNNRFIYPHYAQKKSISLSFDEISKNTKKIPYKIKLFEHLLPHGNILPYELLLIIDNYLKKIRFRDYAHLLF